MKNYNVKIDLELLKGSIETISGVQSLVNNIDLSDNFEEIEKYFRKINFEHSYCIDYKESLDMIYSDLNEVKDKINRLLETLTVIKLSYSSIEETDSNQSGIKSIIKNTKTSINDENITKIEPPTTEQSIQKKPYSTIPIGLAIGATGIAGSVGAVIVNEKYGPEIAESEIEEYHDLQDEQPDFDLDDYPKAKKEEEVVPYHASRMTRESDKYYGNDNELELEDYDDIDDNQSNDDFDD